MILILRLIKWHFMSIAVYETYIKVLKALNKYLFTEKPKSFKIFTF